MKGRKKQFCKRAVKNWPKHNPCVCLRECSWCGVLVLALRNATQNIKCNPRPVCVRVCVCASQASLLCASDKRRKEPPRCSVCPSVCVCVAECFVPKNYGECACAISIENRITLPRSGILHKRPFKLVLVCVCACVFCKLVKVFCAFA